MRIARFSAGDEVSFGIVDGVSDDPSSLTVTPIDSHPFGAFQLSGEPRALADVRLLAPILPSKIIAVRRNYADHAAEMGGAAPEVPTVFLKPSTSVVGTGDPISYPRQSNQVDHEAELAVVIGRLCRDVPAARVAEVVLGYTCANDVTARDLQPVEGFGVPKGFDSFCPLGPWVQTDFDASDVRITCTVNREVRQDGRTSSMVHGIGALVEHISSAMTLLPGDVILTGTPAGVGPIAVGDVVSVTIEGIGTLRNPVVARG